MFAGTHARNLPDVGKNVTGARLNIERMMYNLRTRNFKLQDACGIKLPLSCTVVIIMLPDGHEKCMIASSRHLLEFYFITAMFRNITWQNNDYKQEKILYQQPNKL